MSTDPTRIDESRSPYAPNLISDSGATRKSGRAGAPAPINRPIHGIYRGMVNKAEVVLVHAADKIYRWTIGGGHSPPAAQRVHNGRGPASPAGKMAADRGGIPGVRRHKPSRRRLSLRRCR